MYINICLIPPCCRRTQPVPVCVLCPAPGCSHDRCSVMCGRAETCPGWTRPHELHGGETQHEPPPHPDLRDCWEWGYWFIQAADTGPTDMSVLQLTVGPWVSSLTDTPQMQRVRGGGGVYFFLFPHAACLLRGMKSPPPPQHRGHSEESPVHTAGVTPTWTPVKTTSSLGGYKVTEACCSPPTPPVTSAGSNAVVGPGLNWELGRTNGLAEEAAAAEAAEAADLPSPFAVPRPLPSI